MNFLKLTHDKLSVGDIYDLVSSNSFGEISMYVHNTPDTSHGIKITAFTYEHIPLEDWRGFEDVCEDIRKQWPSVESIAIYHRLGEVPVREASLVIAISSPHEKDALAALEMCITKVDASTSILRMEVIEQPKAKQKKNKKSASDLDNRPAWEKRKKRRRRVDRLRPWKNIPEKKKDYSVNDDRPKMEKFELLDYSVEKPNSFSTQIKASLEDMDERIEKCLDIKRNDLNEMNIKAFCRCDIDANCLCARALAIFQKKKDCKSYLEVHKVLNNYQYRDNNATSEAFEKFIPKDGIEERLQNLESHLGLPTSSNKSIHNRLTLIEDRVLKLESLSPEYIDLWERLAVASTVTSTARPKRRFTLEEVDEMIAALEKKRKESNERS